MIPEPLIAFDAPAQRHAPAEQVCAAVADFFGGRPEGGDLATGVAFTASNGNRFLCVIADVSPDGVPRIHARPLPSETRPR